MVFLGQKIRNARVKKGLTINDAAKATKIKSEFLISIEKGDYCKLPEKTYAYGFVRNYIEFLELPQAEMMALFRREFDKETVFKVLPEGFTSNFHSSTFRFIPTFTLIFLFFSLISGYIFFQYRFAIFAPPLEIFSPKNGEIISSSHVSVSGKTDPNSTIYINDSIIFVDSKGKFSKQLDLFSGKAVIKVKATNRFGKETIMERNIEVK